eukprot:CAMPEP_0115856556 /NCGR_PEP_ID=MMETSP0287-20121206/15117_1 /TAXON_ID=412157 /ORGANISM="Chrysochromulina rotalis, Strain UIO044" /LENGTH=273 /DNA_ID=CAMNT_0003310741 /DNA_START=35 /DNA_END=856 /DNA_ORIENTATION=-
MPSMHAVGPTHSGSSRNLLTDFQARQFEFIRSLFGRQDNTASESSRAPPLESVMLCRLAVRRWASAVKASRDHNTLSRCSIRSNQGESKEGRNSGADSPTSVADLHDCAMVQPPGEPLSTSSPTDVRLNLMNELDTQRYFSPLALHDLCGLPTELREYLLGERLHRLVSLIEYQVPCKVTGMILELSDAELINILTDVPTPDAVTAILSLLEAANEVLLEAAMTAETLQPSSRGRGAMNAVSHAGEHDLCQDRQDDWQPVRSRRRRVTKRQFM